MFQILCKISLRAVLAASVFAMFAPALTSAQTTGAVFINSNQTSNEVWAYARATDGTLTFAGAFSTQGTGSGTQHLESQGSLVLSANKKYLFAVNATSNDITAFSVQPGAQLTFIGKYPSGGNFPNSLAMYGTLMYVLNQQSSQINGFRVSAASGALKPLAGSVRKLGSTNGGGAQVSFNPTGTLLVVAEKDSNLIDTYTVDSSGKATGPKVFNSNGISPFGFAFDSKQHLVISETNPSAISSYAVSSSGDLSVITGTLKDKGLSACWTAVTNSANFPNQYGYITNTKSDSVSGVKIANDGSLTLLNPSDGITAQLPKGAFPLDDVLSADSNYLYVLEAHLPGVGAFKVNSDGSLTQLQTLTGVPSTAFGIAGY